jgi:hypothetical protein
MITNTLKWLGTVLTVAGAIATSLAMDPLNIWLLNLGSIIWLAAAVRMKDPALIMVNAALLTIYGFGFIIRTL